MTLGLTGQAGVVCPTLELAGGKGVKSCLNHMDQVLLPEERGPDLEQANCQWSTTLMVKVEGDKVNKLPGTLWGMFFSRFFSFPLSLNLII